GAGPATRRRIAAFVFGAEMKRSEPFGRRMGMRNPSGSRMLARVGAIAERALRATLLRVGLLDGFVGIAAPAAVQRSGPCPLRPVNVRPGAGAPTDPIDCLFPPDGRVRAAPYPATVFDASARAHLFRHNAGYGPSWSDHPDEVLTVPRVNHLDELDATTPQQNDRTATRL